MALKVLYQIDIRNEDISEEEGLLPDEHIYLEDSVKEFAYKLIKGTKANLSLLDEKLRKYATNWDLKRMAIVDRNILRMAAYELLFCDDIPSKVTINEAVELAKKFGDVESSKFVNGILDKFNKMELKKP